MSKAEGQTAQIVKTYEKWFKSIIRIAIATPMNNPLKPGCIWGANTHFQGGSGIGKTEIAYQVSEEVALACFDLLLSQHPPEDLSGVPVPNPKHETGVSLECIIGAVRRLNKIGRGVLFLDEVSNASKATQGAALSLMVKRRIGDIDLSPEIRILLASNPPEQSSTGTGLLPSFANRSSHYRIGPNLTSFLEWLDNEGLDIKKDLVVEDLVEKVKKGWTTHWSDVKALLRAFTESNPGSFYDQPKTSDRKSGLAWPSPRTLFTGARCIAATRCLGMPKEFENIMMEGWIGEAHAIKWISFAANADLPSAEQVLVDQDSKKLAWKIDTQRQDRTLTVCKSIQFFVMNLEENTDERLAMAKLAWKWFAKVEAEGMIDMAYPVCKKLANNGLGRGVDAELDTYVDPIMKRFGKTGAIKHAGGL